MSLLAPLLAFPQDPESGNGGNGMQYPSPGQLEVVAECTVHPYYGKYTLTGPRILGHIESACLDGNFDLAELDRIVAFAHAARGQGECNLSAVYESFNTKTKIHAIHLASSLGSIRVMELLQRCCGPEILNKQATICSSKDGPSVAKLHYTPIHSALFMSKTEATLWLLDQGADVSKTNSDGYMPLHLLAWTGLVHQDLESLEVRKNNLERVALKLIEKSADLDARTGLLQHRKDKEAEQFRSKTPLELAAKPASSFPKSMLHLLTRSYHCIRQFSEAAEGRKATLTDPTIVDTPATQDPGRDGRFNIFKDVALVAAHHPLEAETLVDTIQATNIVIFKKCLQDQVRERSREHVEDLIRILGDAPHAGAMLLKSLLMKPKVGDPQRYPLPSHAALPNCRLLCTYQVATGKGEEVWARERIKVDGDMKEVAPAWHAQFEQASLGGSQESTRFYSFAYAVKTKVLSLPGIIHPRLLGILSLMDSRFLKLITHLAIAGIVEHAWKCTFKFFVFGVMWELASLFVLLLLGVRRPPIDQPLHCFSMSVLGAHLLVSCLNVIVGLVICQGVAGLPRMRCLTRFQRGEIVNICGLLLLATMWSEPNAPHWRVALALNVALRCCKLLSLLQGVPVLGPLIIAVQSSFHPMVGMFTLMAIAFFSFASVFVIFKDDDRSFVFVLLYLYQMLVLADRDSGEMISGLDIADVQTLDIDREMYTAGGSPKNAAGGDEVLLAASSVTALFGMTFFSLVLLNLTIGMYSNYYEQMEPLAELIFMQRRTRQSVTCMLNLPWLIARMSWKRMYFALSAACLVIYIYPVNSHFTLIGIILDSLVLAAAVLLCQAALLAETVHMTEMEGYLWICHRSDYSEEYYRFGSMERYQLSLIQNELSQVKATQEAKMQKLEQELRATNQSLQLLLERLPPVLTRH
eukprot:TRINITY_DN49030_c0_g1_i1.p1 TRINITY_DN49030_c0_g1~~TRINITY_DN49030_c0_g1_i1.p1  ORF type:complete len:921 (+),score=140.69 TRINITY_DN49030_c0_g1_i1:1-2763(+)